MGFGTERVEEAIAALFPEARVARLDRDTTTSESAYNRIVRAFEQGQTDILVGTQMITKGFDFGAVSVVGVLNADNLLYAPDFRASERAFQLLVQVAGRAGRREREGVVVVQTSEPEHPVIGWLSRGDYEAMARSELAERYAFGYPPYSRLIRLALRDEDMQILRQCAVRLTDGLRRRFGGRVVVPVTPPIDRIRGQYIVHILLKIENGRSMARARVMLREELDEVGREQLYKHVSIAIDVDIQ
jgi:primosomal protein N' (replication factor Y)